MHLLLRLLLLLLPLLLLLLCLLRHLLRGLLSTWHSLLCLLVLSLRRLLLGLLLRLRLRLRLLLLLAGSSRWLCLVGYLLILIRLRICLLLISSGLTWCLLRCLTHLSIHWSSRLLLVLGLSCLLFLGLVRFYRLGGLFRHRLLNRSLARRIAGLSRRGRGCFCLGRLGCVLISNAGGRRSRRGSLSGVRRL